MLQKIRRLSWLWITVGALAVILGVFLVNQYNNRASIPVIDTPETSEGVLPQAIKITTLEEGIYRIDSQKLKEINTAGWLDNPKLLHLYNKGHEVPLWVDGSGNDASISFYGAPSTSLYTDKNIYWLLSGEEVSQALGWQEIESSAFENEIQPTGELLSELISSLPDWGYMDVRHAEENLIYAPLVEEGDHWFWDKVAGTQTKTFVLELDEVINDPGILRIAIWSATEANLSPDHHVLVSVNDRQIIDETWDGSGSQLFEAQIPESTLKNGENQVTVDVPGDIGVRAETNHIDWIEIYFPRNLVANNDRLDLIAPREKITIDGISNSGAIYDVTDAPNVKLVEENVEINGNSVSFKSNIGDRYFVVGEKGYVSPLSLTPASLNLDLREETQGADWIAIAPGALIDAVNPLVEWRTKNGLVAKAIPVETIYDQFGYGLPEPGAIRQFVSYVIENWDPVPQYLVLVGDASYDPKGYLGNDNANQLPTFLVQTTGSGETASDVKFIEFYNNSDELSIANVAIGRIPAQTVKQVETLVDKIIQYESTHSTSDSGTILAVADGQEASFKTDAESFLKLFESGYQTDLLAPVAGATDVAQQIVDDIKQNNFLVVYFGHGSINMWGKDSLFTNDDVNKLGNLDHYPVMMNFTCLTGLFSHPKQESLAEALLWQPEGGAVVVIAPTSLTLASDQSFLSRPLAQAIIESPNAPIGSLLNKVRQDMSSKEFGVRDVMETFLLFGDPATQLTFP